MAAAVVVAIATLLAQAETVAVVREVVAEMKHQPRDSMDMAVAVAALVAVWPVVSARAEALALSFCDLRAPCPLMR